MTVSIDPEFKKLIPPLRPEEYVQLEANIKREGCRDPLVLWRRGECDYVLIDGHNRYEICEAHGMQYAVKEMEFAGRDAVMDWIDKNQLGRRNLTKEDFTLIIGRRYNRMKKGKGEHVGNQYTLEKAQNEPLPKTTAEVIAEEHGVSRETVKRAGKLADAVEQVELMPESEEMTHQEVIQEAKKIVHVSQNTGEMEWYTPQNIIEMARCVMGNIDLDPASCAIANDAVKADEFYDQESDGLLQNWRGNVWLNPPFCQPLIQQFLKKTVDSYRSKEINQACVYTNNATDTQWWQDAAANADAICFVRGRLRCYRPDGSTGQSPLQGQTIMYFGDNIMCFTEIFDQIGAVLIHG
jgi:ParB family chromosome partitioning protein